MIAPGTCTRVPRRVLMTADAVGGVWTYALELAGALAPHGVRIDLAVMGPAPTERQLAEAAALPNVTLHRGDYRLEWMDDPWDDVGRAGTWLLDLARATAPDLVHLNGYAHGALPWTVPSVVIAHSCVPSWWRAVRGEDPPPEWDRYRQTVEAGIHAARVVVAPTRTMLDEVVRWYGAPDVSHVVPNGRTASAFPPGQKEPMVLSAGRLWDEAKNVASLARVAAGLSWMVLVAGDVASTDRRVPNEVATHDSVRWLGRLPQGDIAGWMARAAIYALPARYEPFGLSALEAALAGCALVLGDIPSLREVWGDSAIFVDPDSPAELEHVLHALTLDSPRRDACASACRARALTFTPERMASGYLAAYAHAASRWTHSRVADAAAIRTELTCAS
jgi:glycogen(starch) synthase